MKDLPEGPSLYPSDLFDAVPPKWGSPRWWVVHTRPRCEKAIARRCYSRQTPFYLPLHRRRCPGGSRPHTSHMPLFPGYLFLYGGDDDRIRVLETNHVANMLAVEDQQQLHAELAHLHKLIHSEAPLWPEERLAVGTPVEVTHGALAGLRGKVLAHGTKYRLYVEVQMLHRGVSVEVEAWMVAPLAGALEAG